MLSSHDLSWSMAGIFDGLESEKWKMADAEMWPLSSTEVCVPLRN
jgi:hypothetical protein